MAQSPKRGLYGPPSKMTLGDCFIYSETTVHAATAVAQKLFGHHCPHKLNRFQAFTAMIMLQRSVIAKPLKELSTIHMCALQPMIRIDNGSHPRTNHIGTMSHYHAANLGLDRHKARSTLLLNALRVFFLQEPDIFIT